MLLISHAESLMRTETRAAPAAVRELLVTSSAVIDALAETLREASVRSVVTVARGSSDHSASHFAYLLLTRLGVLATSMPPSAITLHHAPIDATGCESKIGVQMRPASIDFQTPPFTAPK